MTSYSCELITSSVYSLALSVVTAPAALLASHRVLENVFGSVPRENSDIQTCNDQVERFSKATIVPLEVLYGDANEWSNCKIGDRSSLGLMGLAQALDERRHDVYAAHDHTKITMVCHLMCQTEAKEAVSITFARARYLDDGNAA